MTHTFQIAQTYTTSLIGDQSIKVSALIIRRSESTVTIKFDGKVKTCKLHIYDNCEGFYPEGKYSFAPIIRAN